MPYLSPRDRKRISNANYRKNRTNIQISLEDHAILKLRAEAEGITISGRLHNLVQASNGASPSTTSYAGVVTVKAVDAVMKKHLYVGSIEGYDELLAALAALMSSRNQSGTTQQKVITCTICKAAVPRRANNQLYCPDCRQAHDRLRKRQWQRKADGEITEKRWRDVEGIRRTYRRVCQWCGIFFATDLTDREYCCTEHRELSEEMRKLNYRRAPYGAEK